MKLFIDSANVEEIKMAHELGVISGVTTNPSLIAKEGKDFQETIKEICRIVSGPVSAEVMSLNAQEMIEEAKDLAKIDENIVIKLPMGLEALKAAKELSRLGINTNMTLIFSANQALLAARAGATYVSPFVGRIDDTSHDGMAIVSEIVQIFAAHQMTTQVIAASIRHPNHVKIAALLGADIATIPYKVIVQMANHPLTDIGIQKFIQDWETR